MKVTRAKAIEAHCWQCMGKYKDGKVDCEAARCPLYSFMPYKKGEPDLHYFKFNHRRSGEVLIEDSKRKLTDEQRKAAGKRLAKARAKKNDNN